MEAAPRVHTQTAILGPLRLPDPVMVPRWAAMRIAHPPSREHLSGSVWVLSRAPPSTVLPCSSLPGGTEGKDRGITDRVP